MTEIDYRRKALQAIRHAKAMTERFGDGRVAQRAVAAAVEAVETWDWVRKAGLSGVFTDKRGRKYRLEGGRRVALGKDDGGGKQEGGAAESAGGKGEKKPSKADEKARAKEEAAKQYAATVESASKNIESLLSGEGGDADALADQLTKLKPADLSALKAKHGLKASGTKAETARKIAAQARERGEKSKAPAKADAGKVASALKSAGLDDRTAAALAKLAEMGPDELERLLAGGGGGKKPAAKKPAGKLKPPTPEETKRHVSEAKRLAKEGGTKEEEDALIESISGMTEKQLQQFVEDTSVGMIRGGKPGMLRSIRREIAEKREEAEKKARRSNIPKELQSRADQFVGLLEKTTAGHIKHEDDLPHEEIEAEIENLSRLSLAELRQVAEAVNDRKDMNIAGGTKSEIIEEMRKKLFATARSRSSAIS